MTSKRVFNLSNINESELTFTLDTRVFKVRCFGAPGLPIEIEATQQIDTNNGYQIFPVGIMKVEDENSFTGYRFISMYEPYPDILKIGYYVDASGRCPVFVSSIKDVLSTFDDFVFND